MEDCHLRRFLEVKDHPLYPDYCRVKMSLVAWMGGWVGGPLYTPTSGLPLTPSRHITSRLQPEHDSQPYATALLFSFFFLGRRFLFWRGGM